MLTGGWTDAHVRVLMFMCVVYSHRPGFGLYTLDGLDTCTVYLMIHSMNGPRMMKLSVLPIPCGREDVVVESVWDDGL
jgi:hypothetical protein